MTRTSDITTKRHWTATASVAVILTAAVVFGGFTGSASAADHRWDRHDDHRGGWNGGYYRAPPVVYGTPYYAPPLIYGPGLNINIR